MYTTNVKPDELNYTKYSMKRYDADIVNSIPAHAQVHDRIIKLVKRWVKGRGSVAYLELGVGTGLTSERVLPQIMYSKAVVIDFSKHMLELAKRKLCKFNVRYIKADYSTFRFKGKYDLVVSVIGLHHQTRLGKRRLFKKLYRILNPGGVFIFADLMTYEDSVLAAYNQVLHFSYLANKAKCQKTLAEWAYHHIYLNKLDTLEEHVAWLEKEGFKVSVEISRLNTNLLFCRKM